MPTRPQDPQSGRRFPSRALPGNVMSVAASCCCACGLGDVGSSATATAEAQGQEAEQAKAAQVQITNQLDAAQQQAEQRRKEIEAATRQGRLPRWHIREAGVSRGSPSPAPPGNGAMLDARLEWPIRPMRPHLAGQGAEAGTDLQAEFVQQTGPSGGLIHPAAPTPC